jgi:hypothetical protein
MDHSYYVYCVTNTVNGRKYIGSHAGGLNDNYLGSGVHISKAVKKYGKQSFVKDVLWEGPKEFMREMETYWCEYFNVAANPLFYNCTNKGTGYEKGKPNPKLSEYRSKNKMDSWCKGLTKETSPTLAIISEKLKGRPSGMKGKTAWNKGKPGTMTGKKHSPEALAKMFWKREKVECEFCGQHIGVNNIKVHKRKQHGHQ